MTRLPGSYCAGKAVAVAVCMVASARALSQTPSPTASLSVSTHLVQLTAIVRDGKGPVNGLAKGDFTILDQGKPRRISFFTAEPAAVVEPARPAPAQNAFSARADYGGPGGGSVTDNLNTLGGSGPTPFEDTPRWNEGHAMASAKQHLLATIKQLDPRDHIALYSLGAKDPTLKRLCDFSCTRDELLAAVKHYDPSTMTLRDLAEPGAIHLPLSLSGGNSSAGFQGLMDQSNLAQAGMESGKRAGITLMGLAVIAQQMAGIPGRKNLLWLTANLPFSGEAMASVLAPAKIAAYPVDARGLLPMADDPMGPGGRPTGIGAMIEMAEDTGGHAYVNNNDISAAIREVIEQPVAAYTIGFYVDEASVDGKFHTVKLKVDRPDLTVQYPRGYVATKDRQASGNPARNALLAALHSPFDSPSIPLDVTVARVEQPRPHMLQVTGSIDIQDMHMPQQGEVRTADLDVYTIEQDAAGNMLHQATNRLALRLTEEQYQAYLHSGVACAIRRRRRSAASSSRWRM
jgi:VWFA-related protein